MINDYGFSMSAWNDIEALVSGKKTGAASKTLISKPENRKHGRVRTKALWNLLHLSGPIHFCEALVRT